MKEYAGVFTSEIEGLADQLERLFPNMYAHQSSEGVPGGFFRRVREGTKISRRVMVEA